MTLDTNSVPVPPRLLPDHLLSQGISTFTTAEAQTLTGSTPAATQRALSRLHDAGQVFSPARGFWAVIPPEFRSWRAVPAVRFIDDMMRALDRVYYVALLSAAELHGASHHAPQVFQVMCDPPLQDRAVARVRLRFYGGRHVRAAPVQAHNTPTGTIRLATRELTAVDLVALPDEAGGLDNVATILDELGDLNGPTLAALARERGRSVIRRVGWMVERYGRCADLDALRAAAAPADGDPVILRTGAPRRGHVDADWGIRVNTILEVDA